MRTCLASTLVASNDLSNVACFSKITRFPACTLNKRAPLDSGILFCDCNLHDAEKISATTIAAGNHFISKVLPRG